MQSEEVAKTPSSVQDATWFGWLGKRKSCCWFQGESSYVLLIAFWEKYQVTDSF